MEVSPSIVDCKISANRKKYLDLVDIFQLRRDRMLKTGVNEQLYVFCIFGLGWLLNRYFSWVNDPLQTTSTYPSDPLIRAEKTQIGLHF